MSWGFWFCLNVLLAFVFWDAAESETMILPCLTRFLEGRAVVLRTVTCRTQLIGSGQFQFVTNCQVQGKKQILNYPKADHLQKQCCVFLVVSAQGQYNLARTHVIQIIDPLFFACHVESKTHFVLCKIITLLDPHCILQSTTKFSSQVALTRSKHPYTAQFRKIVDHLLKSSTVMFQRDL